MASPKYNSTTHRPVLGPDGKPALDCICCTPITPPPNTKGCIGCCDGTPQSFEVDLSSISIGPGIKARYFYPMTGSRGIYCVPPGGFSQILHCFYGDGNLITTGGGCNPPNGTGPIVYPTDNPRLKWNGQLGKYLFPIVRGSCSVGGEGCLWGATIDLPKNWVQFKSYVTDEWVDSEVSYLEGYIQFAGWNEDGVNASWYSYLYIYSRPSIAHFLPNTECAWQSLNLLTLTDWVTDSATRGVCTDPISFSVGPQERPTGSGNWASPDHGLSGTVTAIPKDIANPCPCEVITEPCDSAHCASTCAATMVISISYPLGGATTWYEGNGLVYYSTGCTWIWPSLPNTLYCLDGYWYTELYDDPLGTTLVLKARAPNVDGCPVSSDWEVLVNLSSSEPVISTWAL